MYSVTSSTAAARNANGCHTEIPRLAALKKKKTRNHFLLILLSDTEETEPSFVIGCISCFHLSAEAPAPPLFVHLGCHQLYCCSKAVSGVPVEPDSPCFQAPDWLTRLSSQFNPWNPGQIVQEFFSRNARAQNHFKKPVKCWKLDYHFPLLTLISKNDKMSLPERQSSPLLYHGGLSSAL